MIANLTNSLSVDYVLLQCGGSAVIDWSSVMGFRKVDYCHMQTFHFSLYLLRYLNYCKQMGNLSWPCFGQNSSLVHRICLLTYLVPFSFISFKQSSAYMIYIHFYCLEYLYQYVKAFSDRSWYKKYNSQTHRLLLYSTT